MNDINGTHEKDSSRRKNYCEEIKSEIMTKKKAPLEL